MAIYVGENNALLLKNDKTVVEFYKGDKKLFGYNNSKHGEIITADNVHPIEHKLKVKLSSDTITDFSGVTVMRYGKNLISYPYYEKTLTRNGVTFKVSSDGTITATGTATDIAVINILYNKNTIFLPKGKTVVLSGCKTGNSSIGEILIRIKLADGTEVYRNQANANRTIISYEQDATIVQISVRVKSGQTVEGLVFKPQIEYGDIATEYERYKGCQTVKANTDGTVEDLTSLSPNMTVFSDSTDVVINISHC